MFQYSLAGIKFGVSRLLLGLACIAASGGALASPPIETTSTHAIIYDFKTNTVLFDKNASEPTAPASMSKLMTIAIVFEKLKSGELSLDDMFSVSEKAWRKTGSKMWVRVDTEIAVKNLIRGAIIQSGNDACIVLAENIAGSEDAFVDLMNLKARQWGLNDSTFANATGWPDPGHKMSMHDLAKLATMIIDDYPEYFAIFSEREFTWEKIRQANRNPLLGSFEGADGLKTGHTDEAGYGVVATAVRDGVRRIVVVNGLTSAKERGTESRRLLKASFDDFVEKTLLLKGDVVGTADVFRGVSADVPLVISEDIMSIVHRERLNTISAKVRYSGPLVAPVAEGAQVAELDLTIDDKTTSFPVFAGTSVDEIGFFGKVLIGAQKLLLKPQE
ncbi:MAG: D-alanyl-D-alanine carboxypeptidase family protein [Pseudomonadota bacterium]